MKTHNNLYHRIFDFGNLNAAYRKARKSKRFKSKVLEFSNNLEENLIILQNELIYKTYTPSPYFSFIVHEPKERLILSLPFRDRVVQHAICNIIEPIFESSFIKDSYACRKNKGVLKGVKRVEYFVSKLSKNGNVYCLKMDIKKYFYSIDHNVLKQLVRKKIRCADTLKLLDTILDSTDNPGLPIGSLTSQLFANVFLNCVDHYIKEFLNVKYYIRYMDDMLILSNSKEHLYRLLIDINSYLTYSLHLQLNNKTQIFPISRGIDFLGYRQFSNYRLLRKRVMKTNFRKIFHLIKINVKPHILRTRIDSFLNLCSYCANYRLIKILKNIIGAQKWELIYSA